MSVMAIFILSPIVENFTYKWCPDSLAYTHSTFLLVVDQYRPHQTSDNIELVKTNCHTKVVLILGGYTSLAQRMDECVNTIQGGNMAVLGGVDQKAKDPH